MLFSAVHTLSPAVPDKDVVRYVFPLLFPQWDMVTVILCVFLLSYMYGEGKSNYFKGSILLLSYLVVVVGYFFSGFTTNLDASVGADSRFDIFNRDTGEWVSWARSPPLDSVRTVGRGTRGVAY